MKRIATLVLCAWFLGGCATSRDWTEATLGDGRYEINSANVVRMFGNTNNPTLSVYECGRMMIQTFPHDKNTRGEIWIDWMSGSISGQIVDANDTILQEFAVDIDGTNVTVTNER